MKRLTRQGKGIAGAGLLASILFVLAGFLFGLVGRIGSVHHAAHVAAVLAGIAMLLWAVAFAFVMLAWVLSPS